MSQLFPGAWQQVALVADCEAFYDRFYALQQANERPPGDKTAAGSCREEGQMQTHEIDDGNVSCTETVDMDVVDSDDDIIIVSYKTTADNTVIVLDSDSSEENVVPHTKRPAACSDASSTKVSNKKQFKDKIPLPLDCAGALNVVDIAGETNNVDCLKETIVNECPKLKHVKQGKTESRLSDALPEKRRPAESNDTTQTSPNTRGRDERTLSTAVVPGQVDTSSNSACATTSTSIATQADSNSACQADSRTTHVGAGSDDSSGTHTKKIHYDYGKGILGRHWRLTGFGQHVKHRRFHRRSYCRFSVASYNVLAQKLLRDNSYLYEGHMKNYEEHSSWDYRKKNLLKEIREMSPEILCLQEVQCDHYDDFFKPQLDKLGYEGVYKKRRGDKMDGCATFFRRAKFKLLECIPLDYYRPGTSVLDRDNVALIVMLESTGLPGGRSKLCVSNTHLLFNPRRGDVKLAQLMLLLAEIDRLAALKDKSYQEYHPVVMCGDFNCEPLGDVIRFLKKGHLPYEGLLVRAMSGQLEGRKYGRNTYLELDFLPPALGVSDQCQHITEVQQRVSSQFTDSDFAGRDFADCSDRLSRNSRMESARDMFSPSREMLASQPGTSYDTPILEYNSPPQNPQAFQVQQTWDSGFYAQSYYEESGPYVTQSSGTIYHNLWLQSVYEHFVQSGSKRQHEVTTNHSRASCTVDYIFYSSTETNSSGQDHSRLRLLGRYQLPTDEDMASGDGLPNADLSSDHVILAAKFLWKLK